MTSTSPPGLLQHDLNFASKMTPRWFQKGVFFFRVLRVSPGLVLGSILDLLLGASFGSFSTPHDCHCDSILIPKLASFGEAPGPARIHMNLVCGRSMLNCKQCDSGMKGRFGGGDGGVRDCDIFFGMVTGFHCVKCCQCDGRQIAFPNVCHADGRLFSPSVCRSSRRLP